MKEFVGRTLMLVENCFPADTRVRNEAFTLAANGVKVSVVALRGRGEPRTETVKGVNVYRIPRLTLFEKLPVAKTSRAGALLNRMRVVVGYLAEYIYFTFACLAVSLYIAAREGLDVIHAHNPPDTLFLVGAIHKLLGRKFVFDHHDLSPELYLSRYNKTDDDAVTGVLKVLERVSVTLADVVIATNESYRTIDIRRNGADPDDVFIVRNGPDLGRVRLIDPDLRLRSMGRTILGYVGAMNPQDGVDYLLRALSRLANELKRPDFYCVLIGDGDSRAALEAQAVELGIADRIWFTGFIPDEELLRYLSSADICLDPNPSSPLNDVSTWIKVMEYMALGKPIVSFDLKETRTSAADAALYVPPNDETKFAEAIAQLIDDPVARSRMGEYGIARIQSQLGWHVTSRNLVKAYGRLLAAAPYEGTGRAAATL
jgi:glycosyltransferase involved in cell wall biosynthesis